MDELLKRMLPGEPNDAYFAHDWRGLWRELSLGGWTAMADDSSHDGTVGFSLLDLTSVAELWGAYLIPLPFISTLVVRRSLVANPPPEVRLSYAVSDGDHYLVPFGESVDQVLVGSSLLTSSSFAPPEVVDNWALSLPLSILKGATSTADQPALYAAVLGAAEAVGAAAALLKRSVAYAKVREQFGRPIGSFQAVKHRLANMHCNVELARSALVWSIRGSGTLSVATGMALDLALLVAEDSVQVHGGFGYTWEAPIHRYYRHIMAQRRLVEAITD
jgi:alkylation response protein AidB-like acyl-CoA dehydrogenase